MAPNSSARSRSTSTPKSPSPSISNWPQCTSALCKDQHSARPLQAHSRWPSSGNRPDGQILGGKFISENHLTLCNNNINNIVQVCWQRTSAPSSSYWSWQAASFSFGRGRAAWWTPWTAKQMSMSLKSHSYPPALTPLLWYSSSQPLTERSKQTIFRVYICCNRRDQRLRIFFPGGVIFSDIYFVCISFQKTTRHFR